MRVTKSSMVELMAAIERDKDIELPMDPAFYDRLHDKIMLAVADIEPQAPAWHVRPARVLKMHWRSVLSVAGSLSGLILAAHMGATGLTPQLSQSHTAIAAQHEDRMISETLESPEEISKTLLLSQGDSEFFVDAAGSSFENLSTEKLNRIMGVDSN